MSMSTVLKLCDVKKNIECSEEVQKINTETLRINKEDVSKNHMDINGDLDDDFEQTLLDITEDDYLAIEECEVSTEDEDKLLFDDSLEMSEGDGNIVEKDDCSSLPSSRTCNVTKEICDIQIKSIKEEIIENSEDFSINSSSNKANKCDILSYDDSTESSEDKNIAKDNECGLLTSSKTCDISGLICDMQMKSIKEGMIENSEDFRLNCKITDTKKCENIYIEEKCSESKTKGNKCDRLLYDDTSTESSENQKNISEDDEYNLLSSSKTSDTSGDICGMQMKSPEEHIIKDPENISVKYSNNEANKCDNTFIEKKYSEREIKANKCNNIFNKEKCFESQKNQTRKSVAQVISSKIVSCDKNDINSKKLESTSLNNEINAPTEKRVNDEICSTVAKEKKAVRSVVLEKKKEITGLSKESQEHTKMNYVHKTTADSMLTEAQPRSCGRCKPKT
ncbi:uncharacterized protein LOC118203691 [Stegodyphus dumicola]|uniref:uncharacterized protein LOC118203691 n=1 Tax=Stegodyphus dumicola TaxID=202533 RepID=UPI0015AC257E|nr:uncharacterized protein LOC118203691 [Stegodyphus dumicola]